MAKKRTYHRGCTGNRAGIGHNTTVVEKTVVINSILCLNGSSYSLLPKTKIQKLFKSQVIPAHSRTSSYRNL